MRNTMLRSKLVDVVAGPMNINLCCKLFVKYPFHFRNVFSTEAHSQSLFSHFASSKLNMSEADINRMFKLAPQLQKLRTLHNAEQIIQLFKTRGLTEVQIANIIRVRPETIQYAERTLEPKIKLLEDFGFVDQNLAEFLTNNTGVMSLSLKELRSKMEFLRNVFQSQDVLVKALLRAMRLVNTSLEKTLKPSLAYWKGWGFCGTSLSSFLRVYPRVLSLTSLTPAQVDLIHKFGADKESKTFKYIVGVVAVSRTETLESKIENLRLCGLSAEEICQLIRASPQVLSYSKETVSEKMNILVNVMELPANYIVKHPWILKLNVEKTIRPRLLVWQKIKSINDFKLPLSTVLSMTEARFVSKIIKGHPESQTLWTIYENAISNDSNRTKSSTKS